MLLVVRPGGNMRVTAASSRIPGVTNYLLPRESQAITVRRHPAILFPLVARALGGLLAASALGATIFHSNKTLQIAVWSFAGFLILNLILNTARWSVNFIVITSERLLLISGVFTRKVTGIPLTRITDISFERRFAGRLLGYGKLMVESPDKIQALESIDYIPYPEQLYLEIYQLIHPAVLRNDAPNDVPNDFSNDVPNDIPSDHRPEE